MDFLLKELDVADLWTKERIIYALGLMQDKEAVGPLIKMLNNNPFKWHKDMALRLAKTITLALFKLGQKDFLIEKLKRQGSCQAQQM